MCVFGDLLINLCVYVVCIGRGGINAMNPSQHSVGELAKAYCFHDILRLNFRMGFNLLTIRVFR